MIKQLREVSSHIGGPQAQRLYDRLVAHPFFGLFKDSGILLVGDGISSACSLVTLALTARALGPTAFGMLVLTQTYIRAMHRIVDFESWNAIIKFGAEALERKQSDRFKGLVKLGTLLDASSAVAGALLALLCVPWIGAWLGWSPELQNMARLFSLAVLLKWRGTPTGVLRLHNRFGLLALETTSSAVLKLLATFAAFLAGLDLWVYIAIWIGIEVFSDLLILALGHYILLKQQITGWWRASSPEWRRWLKFSWWTNVTATLEVPNLYLDVFIVSAIISVEGVAIYKVFKQVAEILILAASPIYHAIFPRFAYMVAAARDQDAVKMALKSGAIFAALLVPGVVGVVISSPWWLATLFGVEYAAQWHVLAVYMLLSAVFVAFISIHPLFVAMGYVRQNFLILAAASSTYLGLAWYLGSNLGLIGIVLAYGAQLVVAVSLKLLLIWRRLRSAGAYSAPRYHLRETP